MNTSFSFGAMFKSGWETFKSNWKFIIGAGFVTLIIQGILRTIQDKLQFIMQMSQGFNFANFLLVITGFIFIVLVSIIISIGWSQVMLRLVRTNTATWNDFKSKSTTWLLAIKTGLWLFLKIMTYAIVPIIAFSVFFIMAAMRFFINVSPWVIVGLVITSIILLIIGIYFGTRYQFIYYTLLDNQTMKSRDIFKKSGDLTKGNLLQLLGFNIVSGFLNLAGLICLVVGLIATIPTTKIAQVKVYEFLKNKHQS